MACKLPPLENFRNNLRIYQTMVDMALDYANRSGGGDFRAWVTDKKFLRLFNVKSMQELPDNIQAVVRSAWGMSPEQAALISAAANRALSSESTDVEALRQAWKDEMKDIRKPLVEAAPPVSEPVAPITPSNTGNNIPVNSRLFGQNWNQLFDGAIQQASDDEIIDHYRMVMPSMTADEEAHIRTMLRDARREWAAIQQAYDEVVNSLNSEVKQTEFLKRLNNSRFFNTPGYQQWLANKVPNTQFNEEQATQRARDIVAGGVDQAFEILKQLRNSKKDQGFFPILNAVLLETAQNQGRDSMVGEMLEWMDEYKYEAGLTLRNVASFYKLLGMANTAGKVAFFRRVANRYEKNVAARVNRSFQYGEGLEAVQQVQKEVFDETRTNFKGYDRLLKIAEQFFPDC